MQKIIWKMMPAFELGSGSWASMILNDEVSANSIMKRATKHYTVVIKPKE